MKRHKVFCSVHNRGCAGCACTEDSPACVEARKPFGDKMDAALKAAGLVVVSTALTAEYIKWLGKERRKVNIAELTHLLERMGAPDYILKAAEEFSFIGLSNTDFFTPGGWYDKAMLTASEPED